MEKRTTATEEAAATRTSMLRRSWLTITILLVAVAIFVFGFYLNSQPEWLKRSDIKLYNQGVAVYYLPYDLLPATDDRPSEYPIVRAAFYFQQAASTSTDNGLITLDLYNLGTLMGEDALTVLSGSTPWFGMTESMNQLAEAIRADPDNEDAKYNLELLEKLYDAMEEEPMAPERPISLIEQTPGYYPGEIDQGY